MKHHGRAGWVAVGLSMIAAALVAAPAGAQGGLPGLLGGPPAAVSSEAARAAELAQQIAVLRALARAKVPGETLAEIREMVAKSLAQLDAGDAAAVKDLASVKAQLAAAKRAVRRGGIVEEVTPEEVAAAGTQRRLADQRASFMRQLASQVEEILKKLPPEQRAAVVAAGQALVREQRAAQPQSGPAGGGTERVAQGLDRLRNANAQDWEREKTRFAMLSSAGMGGVLATPTGTMAFTFPPGGGPAAGLQNVEVFNSDGGPIVFRTAVPGPAPGGAGPGGPGGAPREQRAEVRIAPGGPGGAGGVGGSPAVFERLALNNPETQGRIQPFMALAEQVRAMPPQVYQQQRGRLAKQVEEQGRQARLNAPVPDEQALGALARALASKTGLGAMQAKR